MFWPKNKEHSCVTLVPVTTFQEGQQWQKPPADCVRAVQRGKIDWTCTNLLRVYRGRRKTAGAKHERQVERREKIYVAGAADDYRLLTTLAAKRADMRPIFFSCIFSFNYINLMAWVSSSCLKWSPSVSQVMLGYVTLCYVALRQGAQNSANHKWTSL